MGRMICLLVRARMMIVNTGQRVYTASAPQASGLRPHGQANKSATAEDVAIGAKIS
jgi:hypothetical protein